jgi:hypothetical protein
MILSHKCQQKANRNYGNLGSPKQGVRINAKECSYESNGIGKKYEIASLGGDCNSLRPNPAPRGQVDYIGNACAAFIGRSNLTNALSATVHFSWFLDYRDEFFL